MKKGLFILILAALICTSAFSQKVVRITLTEDNRSYNGFIHSVLDSSILILPKNGAISNTSRMLTFPSHRINTIEFTHKEFSPAGIFIGGIGGGVAGAAIGLLYGLSRTEDLEGLFKSIFVYPMSGGLIGGLGGAIIGALVYKKKFYDPVYIYGDQKNYEKNRQSIKQKANLMF